MPHETAAFSISRATKISLILKQQNKDLCQNPLYSKIKHHLCPESESPSENKSILLGLKYKREVWHTRDHTYGTKNSSGDSSSTY